MGVAAKQKRYPAEKCPSDDAQVTRVSVTKKEHSFGPEPSDSRGERWIPQSAEVLGARLKGGIGHELVRVTGQQIDIPFYHRAELPVRLCRDAKRPKIKDPKIQTRVHCEPTKPRAVILRGMRQDDGEPHPR